MQRNQRWSAVATVSVLVGLSGLVAPGSAAAAPSPVAGPSPAAAVPVRGSLSPLNISGVYVSGVSAGGYMATQLQVAYSHRIRGAAILSAGPYYCAQGNLSLALNACTNNFFSDSLGTLESITATWSVQGLIDPVADLSGQPVYVFHGTNDTTVRQSLTNDLVSFYQHFGASVQYDSTSAAGHAWVTPLGANSCSVTASPFLNNCGTDPETVMLRKLFGSVNPRNGGTLSGTLIQFDQNRLATTGNAASLSLGNDGFAYVPASCAAGQSCRLLVALHGCLQQFTLIGPAFVDQANLNEYADTNNMVVLYPQAAATSLINPNGCFDWWGYLGTFDANYATHGGAQLESIMNMVRSLGG